VARLLPTQNVAGTREAPKRLMPGVYEIIYDTLVYSEPSEDSFRIFNLSPGMKINVVKIEGDWLQIRSKRGRPDGFIKVSAIQPLLDQKYFYKDKTVRFVVGFSRRGAFDTITRMVARHIGKHIPGNPKTVVENMRGSGSLLAANYMYENAMPDGLTIGSWMGTQVLIQRFGLRAIKFDARRFRWIGSPMRETSVCAFTKASGITSIADWYARTDDPVKIGSTAPGSSTNSIPRILREALQLPIELIQGFAGTARIRKAAELGEIDGGCWAWESVKRTWRNGISSGEVKVVLQAAPKKHPELPLVHNAIELAKTHEARQLIKIGIHYQDAINRAFSLPPETPREQVSILRKAFLDTMRDREFLLAASKLRIPVQPVFGNEVEEIVFALFRVRPSMIAKLKKITGFSNIR